MNNALRRAGWIAGGTVGAAALLEVGYVARTWYRYGRVTQRGDGGLLLDRFMPAYEVAERHRTHVVAPAHVTYAAARGMDIMRSRLVRAIFRSRELMMRAARRSARRPQPLVDEVLRLGWGILAEEPGREIVLGAVTRPWLANVRFRSLPPDDFAAFAEPRYVKIAWNLAVEPAGSDESVFRTETRALTTDAYARERFRRYWAVVSPGVELIRRASLGLVRGEAERRVRAEREPVTA